MSYFRPLPQIGPHRPTEALSLAGGWAWFTHAAQLSRSGAPRIVPASDIPDAIRDRLVAGRPAIAGLGLDRPRIMAILNATPDSFSDGGLHHTREAASDHARRLVAEGADILDIGGESTRPGAETVDETVEIDRTAPVIARIRSESPVPISIDTRKARVAQAAFAAGATMLNDVSAMTFDPDMPAAAAASGHAICLMHAQGEPQVMQRDPRYEDVVLDVYDALDSRLDAAEATGIPRERLVADPGIGFGKTQAHNLAILANLSLFHALGVPLLLGASRKTFIGRIGGAPEPRDRMPGSVAVALAAVAQGVQIVRVHDMAETRQALALWGAAMEGDAR
ncbi:dihydropteroate synthase [Palleronia aestuarii]|uniref:Dihydropteroate synthase n=1 Tax=Palleronia aestuarii TaxID=568105 RepID=A0A2W7N561_9RHOB|nr:dihydropteroate synthase [Palleronia aestuarii]PZX15211.1 dihydropteroate synthase [Palleronia aestuarii]